MRVAAERMISKFSPARRVQAWKNLQTLKELLHSRVAFGTGCSGTDGVNHAFNVWHSIFAREFGMDFVFSHEFAAEKVEWKRRFILQHWDVRLMLGDIWDLSAPNPTDVRTSEPGKVMQVLLALFGVECDSVSALNSSAASNRGCVASESGKTGSTAAAAFQYVDLFRPGVVAIENVKNLAAPNLATGKSNLQVVIDKLNTLGYYVMANLLKTQTYGVPMMRDRWWIIGILVSSSPVNQLCPDYVAPSFVQDVQDVLKESELPPLPLSHFLLQDPLRCRWIAEFECRPRRRQPKSQDDKHLVDSLQAYEDAGLSWPPQYPDSFKDMVRHLPERKQQALYYWDCIMKRQDIMAEEELMVDTNMSCDWQNVHMGICPCIVSSSSLWLLKRGRFLQPCEALHLQGFPVQIQQECIPPLSCREKVDLAGNAFSGQVLLAVLLALVTGVDWSLVLGQMQQFTEAKQKSKPAAAAAGHVTAEDNAESEACDEGEGMESEKQDSLSDDGSDFSRSQLQRGSPCIVAPAAPE